jgi:aminomethyltransferase
MTSNNDKLKFIEQYEAVRSGVGLIDLSSNGRIRVGGTEAVMFLNGLITNDMKTLEENHWMRAIFPTVQGRLIAVTRVVRLPDEQTAKGSSPKFILETEAATRQRLLKTIERFTMAGDFRVSDVTDETAMLSLQGPKSAELIDRVLGSKFTELAQNGAHEITWQDRSVTIIGSTHTGEDGFDLIVEKESSMLLWTVLSDAGAVSIGDDVLEALRVEAGIPAFGRDMDETNVVPELDLEDAVSYTKGCYVGQEIIIRIKHRGHVAKKLCRLTVDSDRTVEPGAVIKSLEGAEVGHVTSTSFSPRQQKTIALGYVRYEHTAKNTEVRVVSDGVELPAQVSA